MVAQQAVGVTFRLAHSTPNSPPNSPPPPATTTAKIGSPTPLIDIGTTLTAYRPSGKNKTKAKGLKYAPWERKLNG